MKLLGIAFFFLVALCVCTVGAHESSFQCVTEEELIGDLCRTDPQDVPVIATEEHSTENGIQTSTTSATVSASTSKSVTEALIASTSQATAFQGPVLTTAIRATDESITSSSTPSAPTATQQITQGTTTQPPVQATTTAAYTSDSATNTTQANGTQLAQNESSDASSTKRWSFSSTEGWSFSSTISLQKTTSASGTSGLHVSSPTQSASFYSPESTPENKKGTGSDNHYSSIILPVVITLIVITLSVFSLVSLYRICQKKTPERQENSTEQAQSDKEGVKLLSVKTTSPETGSRRMPLGAVEDAESLVFIEVHDIYEVGFSLPSASLSEPTTPPPSGEVSRGRTTGEHSFQGKNKTRQLFTSQQ